MKKQPEIEIGEGVAVQIVDDGRKGIVLELNNETCRVQLHDGTKFTQEFVTAMRRQLRATVIENPGRE